GVVPNPALAQAQLVLLPPLAALALDGGAFYPIPRTPYPCLTRCSRTRTLLVKELLKTGNVDGDVFLRSDDSRQVDRESERVVQPERFFPAHARQLGHPLEAAFDRFEEALFFGAGDVQDVRAAADQLGIGFAHRVDHRGGDLDQHRLAATEQPGVADGAA